MSDSGDLPIGLCLSMMVSPGKALNNRLLLSFVLLLVYKMHVDKCKTVQ